MHCMILISMLKLMMTFTCDQVKNNIPISPSSDCLIGMPPFENVDAYTGYFSFCR
jgi:hypothetical protein